jgi:hypothetical protein
MSSKQHQNNVAKGLQKISAFELRQRINALKKLDLKVLTDDQVQNRVARIIDQYPFQPRELKISGVYRAQKNDEAIFHNAKRLWYPPVEKITKLGRLNGVGQQRFYASSMPNTTILELKPTVGDTFTILEARTRDQNIQTIRATFIGIERSKSFETQHLSAQDLFRSSDSFRQSIGEANYKKWRLVDDYLSFILGDPVQEGEEHKYKSTVALSQLLFSCPYMDAVNYPSVATNDHGINICFSAEKVDALFVPSEAWMMKIEGVYLHPQTGEKLFRSRWIRRSQSIAADGKIVWLPEGVGFELPEVLRFTRQRIQQLSQMPMPA